MSRSLIGLSLALALAACATVVLPSSGEHPADASAQVPAFRPAPDPLLAEPAPDPHPESAMPTMDHEGHSPEGN